MREAGNFGSYNVDKMIAALEKENKEFTVFGGEPLLMKFEDFSKLIRYGFKRWGKTGVQTNGVLITPRHIKLFKDCNTAVGISIDGPGDLNLPRSLYPETNKTLHNIVKCIKTNLNVGLIITIHKHNASPEVLPKLLEWFKWLDSIPVTGESRLHLLETHHHPEIALSDKDTVDALLTIAKFEMRELKYLKFDKFKEILERLQSDNSGSCVWNNCDPYTTDAVRGISGNGTKSNCGRANKDGVDWLKADQTNHIRQLILYNTPEEHGGCQGCRFFLSCRGFCPGTALDTDWRNKTEHCNTLKALFTFYEDVLLSNRIIPLSAHPNREEMEKKTIQALSYSMSQTSHHINIPHEDWVLVNGKRIHKAPVR